MDPFYPVSCASHLNDSYHYQFDVMGPRHEPAFQSPEATANQVISPCYAFHNSFYTTGYPVPHQWQESSPPPYPGSIPSPLWGGDMRLAPMRTEDEFALPAANGHSSRPKHWRRDYNPRNGTRFCSLVSHFRSFVMDKAPHLHPFLQYNHKHPPPPYNLRFGPFPPGFDVPLLFDQPATAPPLLTIHIVHPLLPWTIRIRALPSATITIYDVFSQLHTKLRRNISHAEFWNDLLDSGDRERLATACDVRCRGEVAEILKGVKRVDFLGPEVVMVGLVRLKEGVWQLKTRAI